MSLAALPAHGVQVVNPESVRRAITEPAVAALHAELVSIAGQGNAAGLAASLDRIAGNTRLDDVAREWLLDGGLHRLALLEPVTAARATVIRLSRRAPVVLTRIDPEHGEYATPLYDVGATARFVLKHWQRSAARASTQADLLAGRTSAVDRFATRAGFGGSDPVRTGIADAFATAPLESVIRQRTAVVSAIAAGQRVDELALLLGDRLADAELLGLVIGHAEAPVAIGAIDVAGRRLESQAAFMLLSAATRRAETGSAAMLEIGRIARGDAATRAFLYESLEDPDVGPSAAASLATIDDDSIAAELGRRLQRSTSESSRRTLVLALKLDGSTAASEELRRFAKARRGSAQLQQEVQQWIDR